MKPEHHEAMRKLVMSAQRMYVKLSANGEFAIECHEHQDAIFKAADVLAEISEENAKKTNAKEGK